MGIGYVSEVISRLTQTRITNFDTSVNGTIVSSNITFPFNQPIYVDASHDTVVSASQALTSSCLRNIDELINAFLYICSRRGLKPDRPC
jgi:hypothetical protein